MVHTKIKVIFCELFWPKSALRSDIFSSASANDTFIAADFLERLVMMVTVFWQTIDVFYLTHATIWHCSNCSMFQLETYQMLIFASIWNVAHYPCNQCRRRHVKGIIICAVACIVFIFARNTRLQRGTFLVQTRNIHAYVTVHLVNTYRQIINTA